jgi:hypothetical protein
MKRRDFIRGSAAAGLVLGQQFSWAGTSGTSALLLEAAQFQTLGGWGLDSQFMDIMGSGFLIAHGIGKPVADAVARVELPEAGRYRIWVRTRDWVAPWKRPDTPKTKRARGTPGIFEVKVDGKAVGTFGNEGEAWHWQDGGVVAISAKAAEIALHDLTGFAGRCAGLFLTRDLDLVPPDGGDALAVFRRKWHGYSEKPEQAGKYDLVVVGGGVAGMCAAVVAARRGVTVALIQDRPMVGGNNSSEVRMHLSGTARSNYSETLGDVLAEIDVPRERFKGGRPMHTGSAFIDDKKNAIVMAEDNITFFPMYRMNAVDLKGGRIAAVVAENIAGGKRLRFEGRHFADCTGDGCVGHLAGADFEISANEHMGRSNQFSVIDVKKPTGFPRCPWALDLTDKPFPGRPGWTYRGETDKPIAGDHINEFGNWFWESGFCHDPITKGEYIRDWNLRAMCGAWDCVKNVEKAYPTHDLVWAAFISGMRESRRLKGDIFLNEEDVCKPNWYEDGIVPTGWKIDVHVPHPLFEKGFEGDAFISKALFSECVRPYYVPYRCLYSRNIPNLFMAGRDISVTREALGTVRVMKTTALMGEVVGMAATLCIQHQVDPRGVYEKHLGDLKEMCGMERDVIANDGTMRGRKPSLQMTVLKPGKARRAADTGSKYTFISLPRELNAMQSVVVPRGNSKKKAAGFSFRINTTAEVYVAVHDRGGFVPTDGWRKTALRTKWSTGITDTVYVRKFEAGAVKVPGHSGREGGNYGLPHAAFVPAGVVVSK